MRVTLIEIDTACPPGYWYALLAGQRLWAQEGRECAVADCWLILPGPGAEACLDRRPSAGDGDLAG